MKRRAPKFVVDTQLFIEALRNREAKEAFQHFRQGYAPFEHLSAVVAQELRAGVKRRQDRRTLERHVLDIFERTGRTVTPTAEAWHRSGDLLASMAEAEGLELAKVSKAFANDILIALSCRESGCVLITDNVRDVTRIRRFVDFQFLKAWPPVVLPG